LTVLIKPNWLTKQPNRFPRLGHGQKIVTKFTIIYYFN
jgi:hypothetical protein